MSRRGAPAASFTRIGNGRGSPAQTAAAQDEAGEGQDPINAERAAAVRWCTLQRTKNRPDK